MVVRERRCMEFGPELSRSYLFIQALISHPFSSVSDPIASINFLTGR